MSSGYHVEQGLERRRRVQDRYGIAGYGAADYRTLLLPFQFSGVSRLDPRLSINGITVDPTYRYYGGEALAASWPPNGYPTSGGTLVIAGAGDAPTLNNGSPLLGSDDDSVNFPGAQYYEGPDTTFGHIGTGDFAIELLIEHSGVLGERILSTRSAANVGFEVYNASATVLGFFLGDSGGFSSDSSTTALTSGAWYHVMFFGNRDENSVNGLECYINGADGGMDMNISPRTGTLSSGIEMNVGSQRGASLWTGKMAYLALWEQADWHQAGAAGPTEWAGIAEERFRRLCGLWPTISKGTANPTVVTRATAAHVEKREGASPLRRIYQVGNGWLRCCSRDDSAGENVRGYLSELASTNLFVDSEPSGAGWVGSQCTITADTHEAPNRETIGDTIHEDATAASDHFIRDLAAFSGVLGTAYVLSAWVRALNRNWVCLRLSPGPTASAWFDVTAGTVGTQTNTDSAGIEDWGNGWYRCWIRFTKTGSTANLNPEIFISDADNSNIFTGLDQDSLVVWGIMAESGVDYPSSYIPTAGATATRNADNLRYRGDDGNLGGVGSDLRGQVRFETLAPNINNTRSPAWLSITDGGASGERILVAHDTLDEWIHTYVQTADGVNSDIQSTGDMFNGARRRVRVKWKVGWLEQHIDDAADPAAGNPVTTGTAIPDDLDRIDVAQHESGVDQPGALISRLRIERI